MSSFAFHPVVHRSISLRFPPSSAVTSIIFLQLVYFISPVFPLLSLGNEFIELYASVRRYFHGPFIYLNKYNGYQHFFLKELKSMTTNYAKKKQSDSGGSRITRQKIITPGWPPFLYFWPWRCYCIHEHIKKTHESNVYVLRKPH